MQPDRGPSMRLIAGLAALCLVLLAWAYLGFILPFRAASAGRDMLAVRIRGYEASDVLDMLQFLRAHPDAAAIQHGFYAGPALLLPVVLTAMLFLLLKRSQPGGAFFGRAIPPAVIAALFFLPILYGLADYGETILGMLLFPPTAPSQRTTAFALNALPILVRLKFVALVITIILLIRFAVLNRRHEQG
jgi:hypothetical protein